MDHLEQEFALENLLFVTEYIQVKHVLLKHFKTVMNNLIEDNNNYNNNINNKVGFAFDLDYDSHSIPQSLMALKLNTAIKNISDTYGSSNKNGANVNVNVKNQEKSNGTGSGCDFEIKITRLGYEIIDSFVAIYNKYIKAGSDLEINIASRQRERLKLMLDTKYANINWNKNHNNNDNNNSTNLDTLTEKPTVGSTFSITIIETIQILRTKSGNLINNNISNNDKANKLGNQVMEDMKIRDVSDANENSSLELEELQTSKEERVLIHNTFDHELQRRLQAAKHLNRGLMDESLLIKWLLLELMKAMEPAVREVCKLMNHSFLRFRKQDDFVNILHEIELK